MAAESGWIIFGLAGQLLFTGRFLVQWLSSERAGRSVVPPSFWYLSIFGATILMVYAGYRRDPVFMIGQSSGLFIYFRNLQLITRERSRPSEDRFTPRQGLRIPIGPMSESGAELKSRMDQVARRVA